MQKPIAVLVVTLTLCTAAAPGAAQGVAAIADLSLEELMEIEITTASLTTETVGNAPARVEVITAAQIERRGYTSLVDVLKDLPDFKVDLAGDPDYPTELVVQGARGASSIVLLLDGIQVSSPTDEPLPILANYPVHNARQVEIVYGPASALYGADAFAAVINIITNDALDASGLAVSGSVGQYGVTSDTVSYGRRFGRVGLTMAGQIFYDRQPDLSRFYPEAFGGLTAQRTGVFPTIFGPMVSPRPVSRAYDIPTSARSVQVGLSVGRLRVLLFENYSRVSTAPPINPDNAVYNADAFIGNHLLVMAGIYTHPLGPFASTSSVTVSRHTLNPQSGYWNVYNNLDRGYKYAFGSMQKFDEQLAWKHNKVQVTTGGTVERFFAVPQGADLIDPITSHDAPGLILGTRLADEFFKVRYYNVGAFGQLHYRWTPHLTMTLGARADRHSRYGGTFNPRAGVVLQPTSATTVKLLIGTAYLAPSAAQGYSHYGAFYSTDGGATYASDYWHLGNPDLKPQRKRTLELNALHRLGASVIVSGSAFVSRFTHLIKWGDAAQSYAGTYLGWPVAYIDFPVNQGNAISYGATLDARVVRSIGTTRRFEARAGLALADGHVDEDDSLRAPIGGMAPWQLRFSTDVDWGVWSVAPRLAIVSRQRLLATRQVQDTIVRETLPGYTVADVSIRRHTVRRGVDVFATIENAFDRRYRTINGRAVNNPEEFVGAPQNPRRLTVGVSVRVP